MFTKDFAKEVFQGKKRLLKRRDVLEVEVTRFDELSVKNLYDKFLELDGMSLYFPTSYPKGRQCEREYMFNIANTLHENVVTEIIKHAHIQRYGVD